MLQRPAPPAFRLRHAPLMQALAQVQFPQVARLESLAGIAPIQDQLQDFFPYMQQQSVQGLSVVMGPGGMTVPEASQSIVTQFTDDDGWTLSIASGSMTLSVGAAGYDGVDRFAERWLEVLRVLAQATGVRRADRLGVRYIDVVEIPPQDPSAWTRWFQPELVGWPRPDLLAEDANLLASITESRVSRDLTGPLDWASGAVQTVIRHGLVPAGTVIPASPPQTLQAKSFLLDLDLFFMVQQPWDSDAICDQYRALHAEIEKFFFWSLTSAGLEHLGFEESA